MPGLFPSAKIVILALGLEVHDTLFATRIAWHCNPGNWQLALMVSKYTSSSQVFSMRRPL